MDVGNSNIVIGVMDGEEPVRGWRLPTDRRTTGDDLGIQLLTLLSAHGFGRDALSGVAACCVVPPLVEVVREASYAYLGQEALIVDHHTRTGVEIRYRNPVEVGADRIANAAAAAHRYGTPAIVADFGTATTVDALSADGAYLGGAIAPGISISLDALFRQAAMLTRVPLLEPPTAIGRDTVGSIQAGVVFGFAGQVDALVRRIANEIEGKPRVIATGGLATLIGPRCETVEEIDTHLTLRGLALIHRLNAGAN